VNFETIKFDKFIARFYPKTEQTANHT